MLYLPSSEEMIFRVVWIHIILKTTNSKLQNINCIHLLGYKFFLLYNCRSVGRFPSVFQNCYMLNHRTWRIKLKKKTIKITNTKMEFTCFLNCLPQDAEQLQPSTQQSQQQVLSTHPTTQNINNNNNTNESTFIQFSKILQKRTPPLLYLAMICLW